MNGEEPTVHVQLHVTFLHIPLLHADIMKQGQGLGKQLFQTIIHRILLQLLITLELVPL